MVEQISHNKSYYATGTARAGNGGWSFVEVGFNSNNDLTLAVQSGGKKETCCTEMQLTAVYMALLKAYKDGSEVVTVYTNSPYVVNSIGKRWIVNWYANGWITMDGKPVQNKGIWEKVYKLIYFKKLKVNMVYIRQGQADPLCEMAVLKAKEKKDEMKKTTEDAPDADIRKNKRKRV